MKRLFEAADRYLLLCDWRDMALLKFCMAAVGVLVGISIPGRKKTWAVWAAALVFAATYIPLMAKFLPCLADGELNGE